MDWNAIVWILVFLFLWHIADRIGKVMELINQQNSQPKVKDAALSDVEDLLEKIYSELKSSNKQPEPEIPPDAVVRLLSQGYEPEVIAREFKVPIDEIKAFQKSRKVK